MARFSHDETRKYRVVEAGGVWVVERGGQAIQFLPAREAAIAFACRAARADAGRGWLGLVTAETRPEEIHCFTPEAGRPAPRPQLRLVASR